MRFAIKQPSRSSWFAPSQNLKHDLTRTNGNDRGQALYVHYFSVLSSRLESDMLAASNPSKPARWWVNLNMPATQRTVLFVGNSDEFNKVKQMLATHSDMWSLSACEKASVALTLLSQSRYDAVIADWYLADSSGLAFLNHVSEQSPKTGTVILFNIEEDSLKCIGAPHLLVGKPYDDATLISALEHAFDSAAWLPDETVRKLVLGMKNLPSPPSLYFRVLKEVQSSLQSLENIGWLIARDPAMSAKLLQLSNSAAMGLRTRVTNTIEAAVYLGSKRIESLLLLAHSFAYFEKIRGFRFNIDSFCQHSSRVSHYSQGICKSQKAGATIADQAFTAGLLHDLGKLALAANYGEQYASVIEMMKTKSCTELEAEMAVFGATHAEMGACMLAAWGLSPTIVEAVARHHKPPIAARVRFSALTAVHVANALDHTSWNDPEPTRLDKAYLESLGLAERLDIWKNICQPSDDTDL